MSLLNDIIASLKKVSNVPVYVGERESVAWNAILISILKLNELTNMYSTLYAFTHSTWRNLPSAPGCESVFVLMWIISCENYDVNHFTINWPEATSNTFVHLWSVIDRLRTTLQSTDAEWLLGPRNAVSYCESMNIPGAAETHLYPSESILPPHIEIFSTNMNKMKEVSLTRSYGSYYDFMRSMTLPKIKVPIDPNKMAMRNAEIAFERQKQMKY